MKRVFRIMIDFVTVCEELAGIRPAVAIFRSENIIPPDAIYAAYIGLRPQSVQMYKTFGPGYFPMTIFQFTHL